MTFSNIISIGLSGLSAFSTGLEAVSSNIANSQTTGFKRSRVDFSNLVAAHSQSEGTGVAAVDRYLTSEQGSLSKTATETNVAIAGSGFFVVAEDAGDGSTASMLFTRSGDFSADAAGNLKNGAGYFLRGYEISDGAAAAALQTINIYRQPSLPAGSSPLGALISIEIDADGRLLATYGSGEKRALYKIPLALFANAGGLERVGGTAFRQTEDSGEAALSFARQGRAGAIEGSSLEISTVDIGREFTTLIETQRAYSTNARVISAADDLWKTLVETAA
jgi:flagellar hook protein FlgE